MASQCWMVGRIEEAVRYSDAGQTAVRSGREGCRRVSRPGLAARIMASASPSGVIEWCRALLARGHDTHALTRTALVIALTMAGSGEEAMAAANGLDRRRRGHPQPPCAFSYALLAYGMAFLRRRSPQCA